MDTLQNIWHKITHIGIHPSMPYITKKRILMINCIALSCIPIMSYFAINNYINQRHVLATVNLSNALISIATLLLQFYNKHKSSKFTFLFGSFVCFSIGALLFHNAGQYYILAILIITMLSYDDCRIYLLASSLTIISVTAIELSSPLLVEATPIPKIRIISNTIGAILYILIAIKFYTQIIQNKMKEIENQRLQLHLANQEKEKIFSIIAHDIKSPFATLESLAKILHLKILKQEETLLFVEEICQKIKQQNKALDDLLNWGSSNIKGGKKAASTIAILPLIRDIIAFFKKQQTHKELIIQTNIPENTQVYANIDHLTIIMRNLMSNAIKFSHKKGLIHISSTQKHHTTSIHIQDYGIGISENKKSMLFTEVQNRSVGTSDEPGSGLGLVFCRDLINQNQGQITIESELDKGSIFTVTLPTRAIAHTPKEIENPFCCNMNSTNSYPL